MPLDFQEVRKQVIELGRNAPQREQQLRNLRDHARELLIEHAADLEALRAKVARAAVLNQNLRCALPVSERFDAHLPLPSPPKQATIIAADGSQINPDRHAAVDYCLVNVGAIQMQYGAVQTPQPTIQSRLFYDEELYTETGMITEGMVALIRDQRERETLAELAQGASGLVITFTDGPIELWERERTEEFSNRFQMYLKALARLHKLGAATAGYVDNPHADLVVRLLEVAMLEDSRLEQAGQDRPLRGVTDVRLYEQLLDPGERSAIFGIQSRSASKYEDVLALHFFYLNVGRPENPWLVRVEVPAWVAENPSFVDSLHAVLVDQCQVMGNAPYPYILHRAHETALVSRDEKEQVEQMIQIELRNRGVTVGRKSPKQVHKDAV